MDKIIYRFRILLANRNSNYGMEYSTKAIGEEYAGGISGGGGESRYKKATVQSLRHSFTTHLLEGSTDLRYIQAFSGHGSSQSNGEIVNPLERAAGKFKV